MITLTLIPRKPGKWYEVVEVQDDNKYPAALVHIDTFYGKNDQKIYNKLNRGETVLVELIEISEDFIDEVA